MSAFLIGIVCLDTQESLEELFVMSLKTSRSGSWIYVAIKPLRPYRTIDLIFQTVYDPLNLRLLLYEFTHTLLPEVAAEDREAVRQYYKQRHREVRMRLRPFTNEEEAKEYEEAIEYNLNLKITLS